ncbi:HI0074 family nucleotidyltransferase substrate-binding subunit [Desulfitobacterium sp.]|uniref:HI0074 family nucleotidyltransferase substrate-binding subunit n=1 Tax=Desulfitobacterium sp. TaxID=49981 RepID=UPI002B5A2812|nr:HI0074 family nucleotidyltransferase substrate-binding subunit [Desulfitobacterium sp.]HVJ48455.1 HI0074 family nucleotidyltransferase substrate-binding subunit [Desulfitobacterium sp.]
MICSKLKKNCRDEGLTGLNSPKTVLREAYAAQLIQDDKLWLDMLSDRNSAAHIYSEQLAIEICSNIQEKYVNALGELLKQIKVRLEVS